MLDEEVKDDESLEVELDENQVVNEEELVENESDGSEVDTDSETQEEDEEELTVTIGDEEPPEEEKLPDSKLVNFLRKSDRKKSKEIRELKKKLESITETEPVKEIKLGEEPTLEGCEYDSVEYKKQLLDWVKRKDLVDQQKAEKQKQEETQAEQWKQKQENYATLRDSLKVKDFDDAEDTVKEKLGVNEQGIILHSSDNPALVVYALSKNPKKLEELSKIKDPILFTRELTKLEGQLKVGSKKRIPKPETVITGSGGVSISDVALEKLREKCIKKGDMTEYHTYKRNQKRNK